MAAVLIAILLSLFALGSCFPQLSTTAPADAGQLTHWRAGVQARYGPLADALAVVGMFRWFSSPVFLVALSLLIAAQAYPVSTPPPIKSKPLMSDFVRKFI
jgi:hypothetical protein